MISSQKLKEELKEDFKDNRKALSISRVKHSHGFKGERVKHVSSI